jgi:hypothetical protein
MRAVHKSSGNQRACASAARSTTTHFHIPGPPRSAPPERGTHASTGGRHVNSPRSHRRRRHAAAAGRDGPARAPIKRVSPRGMARPRTISTRTHKGYIATATYPAHVHACPRRRRSVGRSPATTPYTGATYSHSKQNKNH